MSGWLRSGTASPNWHHRLTLICLWKARMAFAISKRVKFVRREIENRAVNRGAYRADDQLRRFRCRPQTSTDRRETLRSA